MKWHHMTDKEPKKGQFIAAMRTSYPKSYWIGKWDKDDPNCPFEWWIALPLIKDIMDEE